MMPLAFFLGALFYAGSDGGAVGAGSASVSPGPGLRKQALLAAPATFGFKPTKQFPSVYGVMMDWPLDKVTVTVVSFADGSASLYTTAQFGIIGGGGHERVRAAAGRFVREASGLEGRAKTTTDHAYPPANRIQFLLLTFKGVKKLEDDLNAVQDGRSKYAALFVRAQEVLSELRMVTESQKK